MLLALLNFLAPPGARKSRASFLASLSILAGSNIVHGGPVSLPPVNLGQTSFEDAVANPGWFFEEITEYYYAGQFNDSDGAKISGQNELTTVSAITHLSYLAHYKLLGGYIGAEILVPLVDADLDASFAPHQRERGVGDLIISPFILQWNDRKLFGRPFFQRFDLDLVVPTGKYNSDRNLDIGNNIVSLNPYYAFTIFPTSKFEFSGRLHYLWNSENNSPYKGFHASSIQPGQAFHANFAASYEVLQRLRLGMSAYVLQQFTDDKVNGNRIANSEERVFGIGPGLAYNQDNSQDKLWVTLNSYFETGAENRPEGIGVVLRISLAF
jgi:hypothetical protein